MPSRHTTLATLAEAFGHCLLANTTRKGSRLEMPGEQKRQRLHKVARLMDRLSRRPVGSTWHQRAARIHREISDIVHNSRHDVPPSSLWAAA